MREATWIAVMLIFGLLLGELLAKIGSALAARALFL